MYDVYSNSKQKIVNIETEYNLSEIFLCPYPGCCAELKIKSPAGEKAKHFARYPGAAEHTCPYSAFKVNSKVTLKIESFNLDSIFENNTSGTSGVRKNRSQNHDQHLYF